MLPNNWLITFAQKVKMFSRIIDLRKENIMIKISEKKRYQLLITKPVIKIYELIFNHLNLIYAIVQLAII